MKTDYRIYNIYYMLAYAFDDKKLLDKNKNNIDSELFENIYDLFAFMTSKIVSKLIKKGLFKQYVVNTDSLSTVKGKINVNNTIKYNTLNKRKIICEYDEYSENNYLNQIIKSTIYYLLKSNKVKDKYKKNLKNIYILFNDMDLIIDLKSIKWNMICYTNNNKTYKFIINLCHLIINGLLINENSGKLELQEFVNEKTLGSLFEAFVRNYYINKYCYIKGFKCSGEIIEWQLDNNYNCMIELLPKMHTDITLRYKKKELIIDTKFYNKIINYKGFNGSDKESINRDNWYQINSYVTNEDYKNKKNNEDIELSGMLLYAKTDENISPDIETSVMGNMMYVRTIDLNRKFEYIEEQLQGIVSKVFSINIILANDINNMKD